MEKTGVRAELTKILNEVVYPKLQAHYGDTYYNIIKHEYDKRYSTNTMLVSIERELEPVITGLTSINKQAKVQHVGMTVNGIFSVIATHIFPITYMRDEQLIMLISTVLGISEGSISKKSLSKLRGQPLTRVIELYYAKRLLVVNQFELMSGYEHIMVVRNGAYKTDTYISYMQTLNDVLDLIEQGDTEVLTKTNVSDLRSYISSKSTSGGMYDKVITVTNKAKDSMHKDTKIELSRRRMERVYEEYTSNQSYYEKHGVNILKVSTYTSIMDYVILLRLQAKYIITPYYIEVRTTKDVPVYVDMNTDYSRSDYIHRMIGIIVGMENNIEQLTNEKELSKALGSLLGKLILRGGGK